MAFCNIRVTSCIFLFLCIVSRSVYSQKCVKGVEKLDIVEQAYRSHVVLVVKVTVPSNENQTAEVVSVFPTKTGGHKKGDVITFGPMKKGNGCPRVKKNAKFLLFLEVKDSESDFYKLKYDPVKRVKDGRKLKGILCKGCVVKAPKFKQSAKQVEIAEGDPFTFNCKVSGNPKPMAVFLKDSALLPKKVKGMKIKIKRKGGGGRLKINKVKPTHAGVYTCQATNFAGNASLSYTLNVVSGDNNSTVSTATATTTPTTAESPTAGGPPCILCAKSFEGYCLNGGHCCREGNINYCRCDHRYMGSRCDILDLPVRNTIEARYHRQTVAIMGVCIALLLVILICYVVYCKFKKGRSHILKDIQKQYCPVNNRAGNREEERPIANADRGGIIGGDTNNSEPQLTGYNSTNFTTAAQPFAFAQRPQTYDDVILPASESQPLVSQNQRTAYVNREDLKQGSGKRKRINGVAVENRSYAQQNVTASDGDVSMKATSRLDKLKRNRDSIVSTSSSVGSHPELRRPAIPIDEKLATMSVIPPAYGDIPDSGPRQDQTFRAIPHDDMSHSQASPLLARAEMNTNNSSSQTVQNKEHDMSSPSSTRRLSEHDVGRDFDEEVSNIHPFTQPGSPTFTSDYLPKPVQNTTVPVPSSPDSGSGQMSPRSRLQYKGNVHAPSHPYYEHQEGHLHSPSAYRHNDESSSIRPDVAGSSASFYDNQRGSQPSSPRLYQSNSGMGMPFHQSPVAFASARTQHLPLLTNENTGTSYDSPNRSFPGSVESLSPSDEFEPSEREHNRNSHKIEV